MRIREHAFSAFLRDPKRIVKDLRHGEVLLRRRGAPPIRLSSADRDHERAAAFDALADLLSALAAKEPAAMREAVLEALPWTSFLPSKSLAEFTTELSRTLRAAGQLDNYAPVAQMLTEWRATAEILADPALARRLRRPIAATGTSVTAPRAARARR